MNRAEATEPDAQATQPLIVDTKPAKAPVPPPKEQAGPADGGQASISLAEILTPTTMRRLLDMLNSNSERSLEAAKIQAESQLKLHSLQAEAAERAHKRQFILLILVLASSLGLIVFFADEPQVAIQIIAVLVAIGGAYAAGTGSPRTKR